MFDEYLRQRAEKLSEQFVPFDAVRDYDEYVDGKPRYDGVRSFLESRGVGPDQSAVFEDALAGVQAGRRGNFAYVVGVDRVGQADALKEHGASVVVRDLAELLENR